MAWTFLGVGLASCESPWWKDYMRALATVRHLQRAETAFLLSHGRYAALAELRLAEFGPKDTNGTGKINGSYEARLELTSIGYRIFVSPIEHGEQPFRSIYSDDNGIIRAHVGHEIASAASPRIDGDGSSK